MRRLRYQDGLFIIILLLYTASTLQIMFRLPAFASPNEALHYEHVALIRTTGRLPDLHSSTRADERHQPPLYYGLAALLALPFPDPPLDTELPGNPHFLSTRLGNLHPIVPVAPQALPALYAARLVSMIFGMMAVVGVYVGAARILPREVALLIVSLMAFQPMFLFLSGIASNDLAVTAFAALAVTWLLVFIVEDAPPRRYWVLGLLLGCAMLTKANAIFLFGLPPIMALLLWLKSRDWRRPLQSVAWTMAVASPIWGVWLLINFLRNEDLLGVSRSVSVRSILSVPPADLLLLQPYLGLILRSFWFDWSSGETGFAPTWFYWASAATILFSMTGWLRYRSFPRLAVLAPQLLIIHLIWTAAMVLVYLLTRTLPIHFLGGVIPEGRLLTPIVPGLAWLTACGWLCWWGERQRPWVGNVSAFAAPLLGLFFAFVWLPQHYPQAQRLTSIDHEHARVLEAPIRYGDALLLRGVAIPPFIVDKTADVTLYWEALDQIQQNLSVSVQLLIPSEPAWTVSDQQHSFPGAGLSPTTTWQEGVIYADPYRLLPDDQINGPTRAKLGVWVLKDASNHRQPLQSTQSDQSLDPPIIADVVIRPPSPLSPPAEHLLEAPINYGDVMELIAVEWRPVDLPELTASKLVLWWRFLTQPALDYTIFTHLVDVNGVILEQSDTPPNRGLSPTSLMEMGDVVRDEHIFIQPTPEGSAILIGAYDSTRLARLPAFHGNSTLPDGAFRLTLPAEFAAQPGSP
jgi:hypothetical protein